MLYVYIFSKEIGYNMTCCMYLKWIFIDLFYYLFFEILYFYWFKVGVFIKGELFLLILIVKLWSGVMLCIGISIY